MIDVQLVRFCARLTPTSLLTNRLVVVVFYRSENWKNPNRTHREKTKKKKKAKKTRNRNERQNEGKTTDLYRIDPHFLSFDTSVVSWYMSPAMVVCRQLRSVRVIYFRLCARLHIDVLPPLRLLSATSVLLSLSLENTHRRLDIFFCLSLSLSLVFLQLILHHHYDDIVGTCVDHGKTTRVNLQSDLFSRFFSWRPTDRRRGISRWRTISPSSFVQCVYLEID